MTERDAFDIQLGSVARRCARGVRGCTTDEQYTELIDRIVEALRFARGAFGESATKTEG
jgi:hypothetical protein